jgi:hypothetical protein
MRAVAPKEKENYVVKKTERSSLSFIEIKLLDYC